MTIESRYKYYGIPVPFTRREMKPGAERVLKIDYNSLGLPKKPKSFVRFMDEDALMVRVPQIVEWQTFRKAAINEAKIKSDPLSRGLIAGGLRYSITWKPNK